MNSQIVSLYLKRRLFTLVVLALLLSASCHKPVSEPVIDTQSLSYDEKETVNGVSCETAHHFATHAQYCAALENDQLNDGCALENRKDLYAEDCGDDFRETHVIAEASPEPAEPTPAPTPAQTPHHM